MQESVTGLRVSRQYFLIGLATLLGAALVFGIWYFFVRVPFAPAFSSLSSEDAATITEELERLKTPYRLADGGRTILVPDDVVDQARIDIVGGDLPLKGAVGFELFNKSDIGVTDFAQRINYQRALQGELARTIMSLDGIESARVHLSLPEAGIFDREKLPAKASVTVAAKYRGQIAGSVVTGIQQLVAAAVPRLEIANVAVLNARGELLSSPPPTDSYTIVTPAQARRAAFEDEISASVEEALRAAGYSMPMEVKVVAAGELPSSDLSDPGTENLADRRTAGSRDNPVSVRLRLSSPPSDNISLKLVDVAKRAIGFDAARGDSVVVEAASLAPSNPPVAGSRAGELALPVGAEREARPEFSFWPSVLFVVLALTALLFWGLWPRRKQIMAQSERTAFAEKLKQMIDESSNNGS